MAKFSGVIGYCETTETSPGVHQDKITERKYSGDVLQFSIKKDSSDAISDDVTLDNAISIIADSYAYAHLFAICYVRWNGVDWKVTKVANRPPRLILSIGGVYHKPTTWPAR